jgi:hypothetical protein
MKPLLVRAAAITPFAIPPAANRIANWRLSGGINGAPGTLPSGWTEYTDSGMTVTHAYGSDRGVPYIETRLNGTPPGASKLYKLVAPMFDGVTNADSFRAGCWLALVAGSLTNFSSLQLGVTEYDSASSYLGNTFYDAAFTMQSGPDRAALISYSAAAPQGGVNTAKWGPEFQFYFAAAAATDLTFRLYAPFCHKTT